MTSCSQKTASCDCDKLIQRPRTALFYLMFVLVLGGTLVLFNSLKSFEEDALSSQSLVMVAVLGFLTGAHCIGMCGGFMMSYLWYGAEKGLSEFQSHFRYAVAKVGSYAFFGALFGLLGSFVQFTPNLKASIALIGGVFLIYLGAKSLGVFKNISMPSLFKLPSFNQERFSSPIYIGLFKGLMISCAPLQALYLVSASIGSPWYGALMLAIFGIGTLPIYLLYGVFVGTLNQVKKKWATLLSSTILVLFGLLMINRGVALSGFSLVNSTYAFSPELEKSHNDFSQTLTMEASEKGWSKRNISFEYGQKIRWEIIATKITMCNKTIEIPALGIKKDLVKGLNVIEFDPKEHKHLVYTCWMGMMKGEFVIK